MADDPSNDPAPEGDPTPADPPADPPNGDDGTDWKAMARKHEREAKKARQEAETLRQQHQTAEEKAIEEAVARGRQEKETELGGQVLTLRMENAVLRSKEAKRLADPSDALLLLKPDDLVTDDGTVDAKKLGAAIDALLDQKPYLAAAGSTPKVPSGARTPAGAEPSMSDIIRAGMKRG